VFVPDKQHGKRGFVGAAGRTAVALLRSSGRRAKLGSLHLPISLHPLRQHPVAPIPAPRPPLDPAPAGIVSPPRQVLDPEVRALLSRLAIAERRNALIRQSLRRERVATARAGATLEQPGALIDQLVADLGAAGMDPDTVRTTVSSVLAAYGFRVRQDATPDADSRPERPAPAIPGLDRGRVEDLTRQLLAEQPEISSPRYIQAVLETLASDGPATQSRIAGVAKMTSPMARRRLRLTLDGLIRIGAVSCVGDRYALVIPAS
jgi:hypothetical protein